VSREDASIQQPELARPGEAAPTTWRSYLSHGRLVVMRRRSSAPGSAVFFVTTLCVRAGLVPWVLSRSRLYGSAW